MYQKFLFNAFIHDKLHFNELMAKNGLNIE